MKYAPSFSNGDQYDDHCRITFMGENWWIGAVHGPLIGLVNENGRKILDTSAVDWDAYIASAEVMMREMWEPQQRGTT